MMKLAVVVTLTPDRESALTQHITDIREVDYLLQDYRRIKNGELRRLILELVVMRIRELIK